MFPAFSCNPRVPPKRENDTGKTDDPYYRGLKLIEDAQYFVHQFTPSPAFRSTLTNSSAALNIPFQTLLPDYIAQLKERIAANSRASSGPYW